MNVHENQSGHLLPVVALINCHHEHSIVQRIHDFSIVHSASMMNIK
jgi:hypothetical protein